MDLPEDKGTYVLLGSSRSGLDFLRFGLRPRRNLGSSWRRPRRAELNRHSERFAIGYTAIHR